ncbi:MAG: YgcG family protein [Kofleriaceae bacterium]
MHAAALAVLAALATAAIPAAPVRHVEDHAELLAPATLDALDARLVAYEKATGHQIVVWIGRTLDGAALDEWAVRTFEAWKVGRKGIDDGLVVFVLADDRAIDIEVGYGLEDKVPDAIASRIIRETMAPRLAAGDRDGALVAGVDAILAAIEGHAWSATATPSPTSTRHEPSPLEWVGYGLLAFLVIILAIKYPRAAMWLVFSALRGGRFGGGGHDKGGFHGGGGRSGGGGARGHW